MGMEQILNINRGPAQLRVEIETAGAKTSRFQDGNHGKGEFTDIGVELVGVPAQQRIAGVRIDGAQHSGGGGNLDFMLEAVPGKRGMVGLNVELEGILQSVSPEEGDARRHIEIILMLGRLLRLRLDEKLPGESYLPGIVDRHVQEASQMVLFAFEIRVEKGLVTFPPTPEHIVFPSEFLCNLKRLLHLGGRVSKDMGIGVGGRTAHVARVGEEVGGPPEQPHSGLLLEFLGVEHHPVKIPVRLGKAGTLGGDVPIVETPEGTLDLREKLKSSLKPPQGNGNRVLPRLPRPVDRARSERIAAGSSETVPVSD